MKRISFSLLFLAASLCFNFQAQSAAVIHVTFLLTSQDLPSNTSVISPSLSIEHKFTLGTREREGADANGSPLPNFVLDASQGKTVKDTVLFWTKGGRQRVNHGQITGTVRYQRALRGAGIQDRDLVVWLPPGYEPDKTRRYPVVYMHDGQNIFDPVTSAFGVDWSIDETADELIKKKLIEPVIVVGIYNTSDRMKEYTPGDKGTAYMDFVVKTVKPFIDSTYRTKPDRKNTIVGGSSAGGIISFMLVWEHPEIFSKAICMSPAFKSLSPGGWDYTRVVQTSNGKKKDVFFYIDNGAIGLDSQLQPGIDAMLTTLKSKGYKEREDFVFLRDATAKHFEADWAKRFPRALKMVLER